MPRKRKQTVTKAMSVKQKKVLTTRLMQISMRVEDHVYKNIAISVDEAERYYQEVQTYEPKCRDDARSLQVIEKLTRCMKSLINEHTGYDDSHIFYHNSILNENYCLSPTYSETDDTQTMDNIPNHNKTDMTVDLTVDENLNIGPIKTITEVEIHRAMSTLSIRDTQELMEEATNYSQSILEDSKHEKPSKEKVTQNVTRTKSNSEVVNIKTKIRKAENKNELKNDLNKNKADNKYITLRENTKKPVTKRKRRTKEEILRDANNTAKKPQKLKRKTNANNTNYNDKVHKESSISCNTQGILNTGILQKTKVGNKYSIGNNISKKNTINTSKTNKKVSFNKKELPIYNRNVENDLSWLESIRYVRETTSNELDPKYSNLGDDFWENCSFPSFWNDNDFLI